MLVKLHTESVMHSQNIQPQLLNYFSLKKNCVEFLSHYFANPQKMFWRLVFHCVVKIWNTLISGSAFRVTLKTCSREKTFWCSLVWKVAKYGAFSGLYFIWWPLFKLLNAWTVWTAVFGQVRPMEISTDIGHSYYNFA